MLTLFLIIASVFAQTQKHYIKTTGHTFIEIVNDGCYEETESTGKKYYKYKIETVDTTTTITKCEQTDATCAEPQTGATDVEVTDLDEAESLEYIAQVVEASDDQCTYYSNEIEYYYHGKCIANAASTGYEKYSFVVDKLVLKEYEDDQCKTEKQQTETTKRADTETSDIECNSCLSATKEMVICKDVAAPAKPAKYIKTTGHTFVEIVNDGCYEETESTGKKYYKYQITANQQWVNKDDITKCEQKDATCAEPQTGATDVEVTDLEGVTTLEYIAQVVEASDDQCTYYSNEIEYYYHGDCVVVTGGSEIYVVEGGKLVLKTFTTADCQPAAATKRAGENDISCNGCLSTTKEMVICKDVPAPEAPEKLYIKTTGHTFVEIVNDGCYEETESTGKKYYKYQITANQQWVNKIDITKCEQKDATCAEPQTGATYSEAEGIEGVDKFEYIAKVIAAEGENCATPNENEVEYYYHGDCVVVTGGSEIYTIEGGKLVLKTFTTADCEEATTAKRAESTEIACDACLEGNVQLKCVPQEQDTTVSSSEPEDSSSEPEDSSSEPEDPQPEDSSSEPEPDPQPQPDPQPKPDEGSETQFNYFIIPEGLGIYDVYEMNVCFQVDEGVYMQYESNHTKEIKECGYTTKDCSGEGECEPDELDFEKGKWVEELPDNAALQKTSPKDNCDYLIEGNYMMYSKDCVEAGVDDGKKLYSTWEISDNRVQMKLYTDNECKKEYKPEETSVEPEEEEGEQTEPENECDRCYKEKTEKGSFIYECGAFQTFIAVALAFVFFLF